MMSSEKTSYIAAFSIGLGDGVVLERYRADSGGSNKMRIIHQPSGTIVEREYEKTEFSGHVRDALLKQLQDSLSRLGITWIPGEE